MIKYNQTYDLLNDAEIDSDDYGTGKISEFEKQQMMRQFRQSKHHNKKLVKGKSHFVRNILLAAAAAAALMFAQPNFSRQIAASVVNFLQDVQGSLTETLFGAGADESLNPFLEVEDVELLGDTPVKLSDLYITESTISYQILVHFPEADSSSDKLSFGEKNIYINGEQIELVHSEAILGFAPEQEDVYRHTYSYYLPENLVLDGDVNITVELKDIHYHGGEEAYGENIKEGTVAFKVNTTAEELSADTQTLATAEVISTDTADFTFEEIVMNPGYSRLLLRAKPFDSDPLKYYEHAYKIKVSTDSGGIAYFTQWNSPGPQEDGSHLTEFRFDELYSEITLTEVTESSELELQLMRFEGLKAPVEEFETVGKPVVINLD